MGEALSQAQRVAAERDALTALLAGGVDRPGLDLAALGRMFTRLTERHAERMAELGSRSAGREPRMRDPDPACRIGVSSIVWSDLLGTPGHAGRDDHEDGRDDDGDEERLPVDALRAAEPAVADEHARRCRRRS